MSLAESFLTMAKDMLMMSENIKRLDTRVDRIAEDLKGLDRRLMKIELMIDLSKSSARRSSHPELP